ncbi:MAG: LamG domain-containing protein [Fibromonadales bacterium]|nr:LamG domain-containing protein [Fibromonadales bacterium]
MKYSLILLAVFALSCTGTKKEIAGGTSEETNTLARNTQPVVGRDGHSVTAHAFKDANSYMVSAEYGGKFSVVTEFEISAWLKIDSLPQKSSTPHNIIGKFSDASAALPSEFSLALLNGACGAEDPAFAFFFTDEYSDFACEQAILSKNPVKAGLWTFVKAKWDGRYLTLYQDNVMVAKEERISAVLPYSQVPVYFGKSQVPFAMDGLSFNAGRSYDNK